MGGYEFNSAALNPLLLNLASFPKKILVAEPLMIQRKPLVYLLVDMGFPEPTEVENGSEALKRLRTEPHDGIICNRNLAKVDGLSLLKRIRCDPELRKLKVMMLFETLDQTRVVAATRAGLDGYLVPPVRQDELANLLERLWS